MKDAEWKVDELARLADRYASAPSLEEMEYRTLETKQIAGPTAAHAVEEVHVPFNYAYMTFTTGTSAFQTPVGVTFEELEDRKKAGKLALSLAGASCGSRMLVTYAPLVNVFCHESLAEYGIRPVFLRRSSRESLLVSWCRREAEITIGESSFLRSALEDAKRLGIWDVLPETMILLAAGTPLDRELDRMVGTRPGWRLHDLYGCQEFGWLALDGILLRPDLRLIRLHSRPGEIYPVVGGLPVGDGFRPGGHLLNPSGILATYSPVCTSAEWEVLVLESTAMDEETVKRAARSILRAKSRIVYVDIGLQCQKKTTRLRLRDRISGECMELSGPEATGMFDQLLEAQKNYQGNQKRDVAWNKRNKKR